MAPDARTPILPESGSPGLAQTSPTAHDVATRAHCHLHLPPGNLARLGFAFALTDDLQSPPSRAHVDERTTYKPDKDVYGELKSRFKFWSVLGRLSATIRPGAVTNGSGSEIAT